MSHIETSNEQKWRIFPDSQTRIEALTQQKPKRPIIEQVKTIMISQQNQNKEICFSKIPSHTGIRVNEAADKTANRTQNLLGLHTERYLIETIITP